MWIDIYKGLAILLVVIGHLKISEELYRFIYSFHMYAFFFISGVCYSKKNVRYRECVRKNIVRLYVPYLLFAFLWNLTWLIWKYGKLFCCYISLKNIISVVIDYPLIDTVSIGPAWFLCAMLIVKCMYELLYRCFEEKKGRISIACIVLFGFGYVCRGIRIPFSITSALTAFLFFNVGDMAKNILVKIQQRKKIVAFIKSGVCVVLVSISAQLSDKNLILASNALPGNVILMLSASMIGCFLLVYLSNMIVGMRCLQMLLTYLGKNSLIIMGVHSEIRVVCYFILEHLGMQIDQKTVYIVFVLTIISCVFIIECMDKWCYRIGRRYSM